METVFHDFHSWNLELGSERRSVTRLNREGSGIVYMKEKLAVDESITFTVAAVDPEYDGQFDAISLKVGITTCDPDVVTNFPFHVIEPCQPSHDCEGKTVTMNVKSAFLNNSVIRLERRVRGSLKVFVDDELEFSLLDPNDSFFPFSTRSAYPLLVLSGSVSKIRVTSRSVLENEDVVSSPVPELVLNNKRDACCVVCLDKSISFMAVPCNHAVYCDEDAGRQKEKLCPICRKGVTNFVRIYLP